MKRVRCALIAPIEMATGTQAYFCGKPNPLMMRTGLNMLGCHSAEAVMVGACVIIMTQGRTPYNTRALAI